MDMESFNDSFSCLYGILAADAKSSFQIQTSGSWVLELFAQVINFFDERDILLHDPDVIYLMVLWGLVQLLGQWVDSLLQMLTLATILFLDVLVNIDSLRLKISEK